MPTPARKKLAAVVTAIFEYSHAQHILDRFLDGYGWAGRYHHPPFEIAGLYVDQHPANDLTQDRLDRHPEMKLYPTIAEAVTLGTGKLAVDGVIIVGEHGVYPLNERGQMEHPQYRFFQSVVDVFQASGRSVPIFSDKQLGWQWERARQIVDTSHRMGFPFQGGSSCAVTWRLPSIEMPLDAHVQEALAVGYGYLGGYQHRNGGVAGYDFHILESLQCMVERRRGGETGVEWVEAYSGDRVWDGFRRRTWSPELFRAALARSLTLVPARPDYNAILPTLDDLQRLVPEPVAYQFRYRDGLLGTVLLLNGLVTDYNFACHIEGRAKPLSTEMFLAETDGRATLADFFSPLVYYAEQMFTTGKAQYPIERTLLTSGIMYAGVESLTRGQIRLPTPHLDVTYHPGTESVFERV